MKEKKHLGIWPIIILFFTSVDTVLFGVNGNKIFLFVPRVVGVLFIGLYFIHYNKTKLYKTSFVVLLILLVMQLFSNVIWDAPAGTAISHYLAILVAFAITELYSVNEFSHLFDSLMFVLSVSALVVEIMAWLFPSVFLLFPTMNNTAGASIQTFIIGSVRTNSLGVWMFRSQSIFWEPAAFSIYLFFAILNQLFVLKKINNYHIIVYFLATIITFSTTGYISVTVLIAAYLFLNNNGGIKKRIVCIFALLGIVCFVIFAENSTIYERVFGKILGDRYASTSLARISSVINGMRISFDYPIFGISPNNMREYMGEYASTSSLGIGNNYQVNANTITYHFAAYGIVFGMIILYGYALFAKKYTRNGFSFVLLFIAIMLAYCGEAFYSFFPFIFMFYGIKSKDKVVNDESIMVCEYADSKYS